MVKESYFLEIRHNPTIYRIVKELDNDENYTPIFHGTQEECHAECNRLKGVKL